MYLVCALNKSNNNNSKNIKSSNNNREIVCSKIYKIYMAKMAEAH